MIYKPALGGRIMRILNDRDIFGDPYESTPQPPPYDDWESQGAHSRLYPPPEEQGRFHRHLIEERRFRKRIEV